MRGARLLQFVSMISCFAVLACGAQLPDPNTTSRKIELSLGEDIANRLMALSVRAQQPGENGWPRIADAMNVLDELHAEFDVERLRRNGWHRKELYIGGIFDELVKGDDRQIAVEALAKFRKSRAAEMLNQAATSPHFVVPLNANTEIGYQPWWNRIRNLAKAFRTSMQQAALDDDAELIISDAKCVAVLARVASYQPDVVSNLVGQACATMFLGELRFNVGETDFTEAQLRELLQLTSTLDLAPFSHCLEGERLRIHRMIDLVFDESQNEVELQRTLELFAKGIGPNGLAPLLSGDEEEAAKNRIDFASRQEMHVEVDRLINLQLAIVSKPISEWRGAAEQLDLSAKQLPEGQPFAKAALYAGLGHLRSAAKTQAAYIDGPRLVLAINLYKAKHGRFPSALSKLVPDFLPAIPLDVTIAVPFGYRPPNDDDSSFTLYMIGVDGEDNGGVFKENQEWAFDPAFKGEGYDYIINHPRPNIE